MKALVSDSVSAPIVSPIRTPAVAATDIGLRATELTAGVRSGNWPPFRQAQALLNATDVTTTKGLGDRAIVAVLVGCALRRPAVAARTDGRSSGGFTPEIPWRNHRCARRVASGSLGVRRLRLSASGISG